MGARTGTRAPRGAFVERHRVALVVLAVVGALVVGFREPSSATAGPFVPSGDGVVLERLPSFTEGPRSRELARLRKELSARPGDLTRALRVARAAIELSRARSDPRYLGQAESALRPFWEMPSPPTESLVLRATIRQSSHDFEGALSDLDVVLRATPDDAQAWLTRAVVRTVLARYDEAKADCAELVRRAPPLPMRAIWTARRVAGKLWRNERARSRANVAHHYDLDGRLYDLFLDRDRQYSCAYFERPDMSLDEAQLAKKRHIAAKLLIGPGQKTLDIGSGWGGMALYLARHCGADVTGVTLSTEQLGMATQRAAGAGLAERVRFRLEDYRDVQGPFDRVVSVGMFEHVGPAHYDEFFAKIADLLTEDGVALLHTIGRPDGPGAEVEQDARGEPHPGEVQRFGHHRPFNPTGSAGTEERASSPLSGPGTAPSRRWRGWVRHR